MNKLNILVEKIADLKKAMRDQGKAALQEAFQEFFAKHPEASAIVWTQYTPYFNDGDACIFRLGGLELKVNVEAMAEDVQKLLDNHSEEYGHEEDCAANLLSHFPVSEKSKWNTVTKANAHRDLTASEQSLADDFDSLKSSLGSVEQVLEVVLGDHCLVTATPDGFEVTEYDHE